MNYRIRYIDIDGNPKSIDVDDCESEEEAKEEIENEVLEFKDVREL